MVLQKQWWGKHCDNCKIEITIGAFEIQLWDSEVNESKIYETEYGQAL